MGHSRRISLICWSSVNSFLFLYKVHRSTPYCCYFLNGTFFMNTFENSDYAISKKKKWAPPQNSSTHQTIYECITSEKSHRIIIVQNKGKKIIIISHRNSSRKIQQSSSMFQCIIQQRNGWIHAPSPEMRDVFPGTI